MPPKRGPGGPGRLGAPGGGRRPSGGNPPFGSSTIATGARGPGGPQGGFGLPVNPLTVEQVSLLRAWIDQGAK